MTNEYATPPGGLPLPDTGGSGSLSPSHQLTLGADRPELGHLARWHVSSHKYGFGIENLRDNDPNTFWQYVLHSIPGSLTF